MAPDVPLRVYWHRETFRHRPPDGAFKLPSTDLLAVDEPHPDQPARARNIKRIVEEAFESDAAFCSAPAAERETIERIHDAEYVSWLESFCADGGGRVDGTTTGASEATFDAARRSAGAAVAAVEHALDGREGVPYALTRPSGHHAQRDTADGFCFFNNAAIAAQRALDAGVDRVAVVDWDVHHGNGTQDIFYDRDDVLLVSIHNDHGSWDPTHHPQTGARDEDGVGDGEGHTVNVPVPPGTGDRGYERVFDEIVEPVVSAYDPGLLVYSAGQDPGVSDPLGRNLVTREGFRTLGERASSLAAEAADGRFAVVQEGGYQISHLAFATLGVLEGAVGEPIALDEYGTSDPFAWLPETPETVEPAVEAARDHHGEYWPV